MKTYTLLKVISLQKKVLPFMKFTIVIALCYLPYTLFCQSVIEGKWKTAYGICNMSAFKKSSAFNLRYISPRFRWSDIDLTEEQEKQPDVYNKTRIMFELIYSPPIANLCTGLNVQYRILKFKKVSLETYGGIKLFFTRSKDFAIKRPFIKGSSKGIWYLNAGLLLQANLGIIEPFVDIGYDGIMTVGTELNLRKIYRKPKGRYKLRTKKNEKY